MSLYYTPPAQEQFDDLKRESIKLWQTYDDTYGYVSEKVDAIKDLENIGDNFMFMFAMFDWQNQNKINNKVRVSTFKEIQKRLC